MSDSRSRYLSLADVLPRVRQARRGVVVALAPLFVVTACHGDIASPPQAASIKFGVDTIWMIAPAFPPAQVLVQVTTRTASGALVRGAAVTWRVVDTSLVHVGCDGFVRERYAPLGLCGSPSPASDTAMPNVVIEVGLHAQYGRATLLIAQLPGGAADTTVIRIGPKTRIFDFVATLKTWNVRSGTCPQGIMYCIDSTQANGAYLTGVVTRDFGGWAGVFRGCAPNFLTREGCSGTNLIYREIHDGNLPLPVLQEYSSFQFGLDVNGFVYGPAIYAGGKPPYIAPATAQGDSVFGNVAWAEHNTGCCRPDYRGTFVARLRK